MNHMTATTKKDRIGALPVTILGSTGSVGLQSMDVAAMHGLRVEGIAGGRNISALEEQIRRFKPLYCAVSDPVAAKDLAVRVSDTDTKILSGNEGVVALAEGGTSRVVMNSIMGSAGLAPTLAAIRAGKNIALANKETLVTAGEIVMAEAKAHGVSVLPVDSEHCAIFQCLNGEPGDRVKRLILTCSGGPFYGKKRAELADVTRAQALAHPTWKMGPKITVDCASLANKGLELIEAVRLFDVAPEDVEVVIHRESIVHSMVRFCDGAVMAQLSVPDMRLCIQYALTYPDRMESPVAPLDLLTAGPLTFAAPDEETFSFLPMARRAAMAGGTMTATFNGANEAAVALFLEDKIRFASLFDLVGEALDRADNRQNPSLEDIFDADATARRWVTAQVK